MLREVPGHNKGNNKERRSNDSRNNERYGSYRLISNSLIIGSLHFIYELKEVRYLNLIELET
jgi:hypothetical protein